MLVSNIKSFKIHGPEVFLSIEDVTKELALVAVSETSVDVSSLSRKHGYTST